MLFINSLIWYLLCYISSSNTSKVSLDSRFDNWPHLLPSCIIDVTECPIEIPSIGEWVYYSFKKKKHTLKYEIVCSFVHCRILWILGPFPGTVHDLRIARTSFVLQLLRGEKALADKAYVGDAHFLTPHRPAVTAEQKEWNALMNQHRQMVERMIKRMKQFRAIKETWRHDLPLHPYVFTVVGNLTNLCLLHQPLNA